MSKAFQLISVFAMGAFLGCGSGGGDSGVSGSKRISELSASEIEDLCTWGIDQLPSSITCMGITIQLDESRRAEARSECTDEIATSIDCDATVAQAEACFEAAVDDICSEEDPPECADLDDCDVDYRRR